MFVSVMLLYYFGGSFSLLVIALCVYINLTFVYVFSTQLR